MKVVNGKYHSPTKGLLSENQMVNDIASFVDEEPSSFYRLVIGTDSQSKKLNGHSEVDFVTAVVVHRMGKGARYFWRRERRNGKPPILRDKIYTETLMSLDAAQHLVPEIRK